MKTRSFARILPGIAAALLFAVLSGNSAAKSRAETPPDEARKDDARKLEIVYGMYAEYREDFPGIEEMEPVRALELWRENRVVFVDTRTPEEMAVSTLPGAISREDFLADPDRFQDRLPVAYCTISYRSGYFAREMAEANRRVVNLRGGMLAWALEGGPIFDENGETRRMHVYGEKWDYPPAGYESIRFGRFRRFLRFFD